jgi:hypothetical protein
MFPCLDNLIRWGNYPVVFPCPTYRINIDPFTVRVPEMRVKSSTLGVITGSKPVYREWPPHGIDPIKNMWVDAPIVTIRQFAEIIC